MNPHEFLGQLSPSTMKFGLERMLACDAALGHPWKAYRSIHVAGTNGKGSTCAFAESILREGGHRVGLYTSPHLESVNERLRVDGQDCTDADLAAAIEAVTKAYPPARDPSHPDALTYFELLTALALWLFRERGCDTAIIEVGLGGRYDATNIITPAAWAIATIGFDHTEFLGKTLAAIAKEKAGILKEGVPGAILTAEPEALAVIRQEATVHHAPAFEHRRDFALEGDPPRTLRLPGRSIANVTLALAGEHQQGNAALAATAATLLDPELTETAIREGLARARWPGRLERVGDVILDGAHNAEGAAALARELKRLPPPIQLVFGALGDKDVSAMLSLVAPCVDTLYLVAPANPRALSPERYRAQAAAVTRVEVPGDLAMGLAAARQAVQRAGRGQVVVAGSLYLVGEARRLLLSSDASQPL